ncbi:hypothetical protein Vadar_008228 [Vaccinium darrowii]|uniref:Uncharacterized protein n=1 Tax=Vaccinium darrowii TaxID=229202 RepID=A0ACB7Z2K6_9ERIC|nr:hypothetical protein Vadar_008228 [Vaccinium darrowii]
MNKSMDRSSSDNGVWIPVVKNTRCHVHGMVNHRYQGFHTLFVDNLPVDVGINEFRELFNKYGVVRDVFIPLKRSKVSGNKFGFVRYDCHVSADVAISKANGIFFKERKLFVKYASFGKKDVIEDRRLEKSRNHGFKAEADFPNRTQSVHSIKIAEFGAPFLRNNRRVGSYAEALAGHKEERKLAYKMIDSVSTHEDQFSQVPMEAQSSEKGTEEDPNVSTIKPSQDLDSFVEDSLGLQSLFHEIHVGESVEKMSNHEKVLDGNPIDPSSLDEAASRVSDFEDLDLVSNDPIINKEPEELLDMGVDSLKTLKELKIDLVPSEHSLVASTLRHQLANQDVETQTPRILVDQKRISKERVDQLMQQVETIEASKSKLKNERENFAEDKKDLAGRVQAFENQLTSKEKIKQAEKLQQGSELARVRLKEMDLPNSILALEGNFTLPTTLKEDLEVVQISGGPIVLEVKLQEGRLE